MFRMPALLLRDRSARITDVTPSIPSSLELSISHYLGRRHTCSGAPPWWVLQLFLAVLFRRCFINNIAFFSDSFFISARSQSDTMLERYEIRRMKCVWLILLHGKKGSISLSAVRIADKAPSARGEGPKWRRGRLQFTDEHRGLGGRPTHSYTAVVEVSSEVVRISVNIS